jgi:predicted transcriptional regulator with HTH domain
LDAESPCQTLPEKVPSENEVSSKQKNLDDSTHQSKEFLDFLELFNAHRELFLKILHDPSLLVPSEQQDQEASSSHGVPMSKLESFPRPGGSSGKRNPIFDRSDSEKSRRAEIQRSPSRPKGDLEGVKVISARMPSGVEASTVSLVESRSLKKNGTTSNRFKAISKKIKDVVKDNRRELARITKDGVFHKMPYGQKMVELTKTASTKKFVQEEKQIRRSYSIAESVDKYSTLYDSISRESKSFPERPSTSTALEDEASLHVKKSPMHMKRIISLPEIQLYSPHRNALIEVPDSCTMPKTCNIEPAHSSSSKNGSTNIYTEGNYYLDDIYSEQNDGGIDEKKNLIFKGNFILINIYYHFLVISAESAYLGSLEEDLRSILRTPSLCSFAQSFSHRRISSLPSFDRSFLQDHNYSFTEHSVAGEV